MQVTDKQVFAKYDQINSNAHRRGLEFDLGYTSVKNLLRAKKCYYTGVKFDNKIKGMARTVDRIDPNKGYIKGNVVACCAGFNELKNEIEHTGKGGVKAMIKALDKIHKRMEK